MDKYESMVVDKSQDISMNDTIKDLVQETDAPQDTDYFFGLLPSKNGDVA